MSKSSSISRSSSSESLVDSSSHETPGVDEKSKSTAPPIMKTKKSAQREAYKANASASANKNSSSSSSSSATYTEKNHNIRKNFETEIDTALQHEKYNKQLDSNGALTVYDLSNKEIAHVAEWLKLSPERKLTKLIIAGHNIDKSAITALVTLIKSNTTVTSLTFFSNNIPAEQVKELAPVIANSQITTLDLWHNNFGAGGAKALSDLISKSGITKLILNGNNIGVEGGKAVAAAIPNSKVNTLILFGEQIGNEGTKALAGALSYNQINTLELVSAYFSHEGAQALADAMKINSSIKELNLEYNNLNNESAIKIVNAVIANPNSAITAIKLSVNEMDDRCVEAIAKALIGNPNSKITTLNPWGNISTGKDQKFITIINPQCALNARRAQIEDNITDALVLLTAHPNPNDGNVTSVRDVNSVIAKNLFVLDKAGKLNTDEVRKNPNSVFNKYT